MFSTGSSSREATGHSGTKQNRSREPGKRKNQTNPIETAILDCENGKCGTNPIDPAARDENGKYQTNPKAKNGRSRATQGDRGSRDSTQPHQTDPARNLERENAKRTQSAKHHWRSNLRNEPNGASRQRGTKPVSSAAHDEKKGDSRAIGRVWR
jgi:hypothetical protein